MNMIKRVERALNLSNWVASKRPTSRDLAISAITALREPNEAMLRAGNGFDHDQIAREVWQAMIDAVLADDKAAKPA